MSPFLKVRTRKEVDTPTKVHTITDGKILEVQEAHVRLQEAMDIVDLVLPTSKLETEGTQKSPLNLGSMTRAQATRRIRQKAGSSPKTPNKGGTIGTGDPRWVGLNGGSCYPFHPYITQEIRPTPTTLCIHSITVVPHKFESENVAIHTKDFAYLVKWCQNHNTMGGLNTIRGVQLNKLSFDKRGDRVIAPNRIFEATLLLSLFDANTERYDECRQLCRFLYSVEKWEFDSLAGYPDITTETIGNRRFSNDITAFNKLTPFCQSLFIEIQYYYHDAYTGKTETGNSYWFKTGFDVQEIMTGGIASSTYCFNKHNLKETMLVTVDEFSKMSLHGQIILMKHTVWLDNEVIYISLDTKNEIGKLGRQYSTITEISRIDRDCIASLKGYDMEAAMQTIFLHLLPTSNVPFFRRYIKEKREVRKEISTLMDWSIEKTKEVLQAIVMGEGKKSYTKRLEKSFGIYTERDMFAEKISAKATDNTQVAKYARKRTKEKVKEKNSYAKIDFKKMTPSQSRTFMFFYWSYYERTIQDVMCPMFTNPLPLHDAVYSQCSLPPMEEVEKKIKECTGIDMKLGKA